MSTRTTIALGLIFAALLAAYVLTGQRERRIERAEFESKKLFDFSAADITTFSIQQRGAEAVEAIRGDGGGWAFTGKFRHIPANGPLWDQLAEVVTVAQNERPIPGAEADLASFELDPPRLTVVVGTKQGVAHQIDFGGIDPTQRHRYLQMPGTGVFLSSADLFSIMNRTLAELRDRRIFSNLAEGLVRFEYRRYLVSSEPDAELSDETRERMAGIDDEYVKDDGGEWRMVRPAEARARGDYLEALGRVLPTLGARAFIDEPEDLSDYGLHQPFARMTVYGPDGRGETLLLGGIDSASTEEGEAVIYVKREDNQTVMAVDARLFNLLPGEPAAFRERRLFTREASKLTTIRYADSAHRIALASDGAGWRLTEPPTAQTDPIAVSMYIAQLKRIEGRSFPEDVSADAFGSPRIAMEFEFGEGGGTPTRIEIGAPVPESDPLAFYARQDFGPVTVISFEDFQALQATPFDFYKKTLFEFDPKTVTELDLTVEGARYVFSRSDGRWSVVEPSNSRLVAQSEVNDFVAALGNLQARGIAEPPPSSDVQGVENPVLAVSLRTTGVGGTTLLGPIRIGNLKTEATRERFATVEGRSVVYFVDQTIVDAARLCIATVQSNN